LKLDIKALFVDLDGTLVDSREAYTEALKAGMSAIGKTNFNYDLTLEIPRRLEQGLPIDDLIGNPVLTEKFLKKYLSTYYDSALKKSKPFPNVTQTLSLLSKKFSLALITMRFISQEKLAEELKRLGFTEHFNMTITALDVDSPKPSPEALLKCAKCLNVPACECAIVGDSIVDIQAGKRAGTKTIAVLSGLFRREELEKQLPDAIIESFSKILGVLI